MNGELMLMVEGAKMSGVYKGKFREGTIVEILQGNRVIRVETPENEFRCFTIKEIKGLQLYNSDHEFN